MNRYPISWRQRRWNGWLPYPWSVRAYGFFEWTIPQAWSRLKMRGRKLRRELARRMKRALT